MCPVRSGFPVAVHVYGPPAPPVAVELAVTAPPTNPERLPGPPTTSGGSRLQVKLAAVERRKLSVIVMVTLLSPAGPVAAPCTVPSAAIVSPAGSPFAAKVNAGTPPDGEQPVAPLSWLARMFRPGTSFVLSVSPTAEDWLTQVRAGSGGGVMLKLNVGSGVPLSRVAVT
jgi:hypothetical protein